VKDLALKRAADEAAQGSHLMSASASAEKTILQSLIRRHFRSETQREGCTRLRVGLGKDLN
jgi:hypothetical protein